MEVSGSEVFFFLNVWCAFLVCLFNIAQSEHTKEVILPPCYD